MIVKITYDVTRKDIVEGSLIPLTHSFRIRVIRILNRVDIPNTVFMEVECECELVGELDV